MALATAPARTITPEEQTTARTLLDRARAAMRAVENYDQAAVDRLCQTIGWAGGITSGLTGSGFISEVPRAKWFKFGSRT